MDITWYDDDTIGVKPPAKPKKLSGTRFASVFGLNRWNTPFQAWCQICKVYEPPFEDTKYTIAGKAIEPKQIAYMREFSDSVVDPTQVYGPDPFKKTWGNFFDHPIFGGMWDALLMSEDNSDQVEAVFEFKTTKRAEDWEDDVPEYYALQAALYAYLLGCEDVIMVATFLQESDYEHPEDFEVTEENTVQIEFMLHERYPNFEEDYIEPALAWWNEHVETGVSPQFDEKADADYLKVLRNTSLNPTTDIDGLLSELASLNDKIAAVTTIISADEKRVKAIKDQLKQYAMETIGESDTATLTGAGLVCTLTKTSTMKVDEKAMQADGVYDKYAKPTESTRFTVKSATE